MNQKLTVSAIIAYRKEYLSLMTIKDEKWGLPAGGVEPGENLEKALRREMREEIGTDVVIRHVVGIYYFKSDHGNAILNVVYAALPRREPRIIHPQEVKSLAWLTLPEWKQYARAKRVRAPRAQLKAIEDYRKGRQLSREAITDLFL